MKRFQFKFESLEKVRKIREEEALLSLARAQGELVSARSRKEQIETSIEESMERKEQLAEKISSPVEHALEVDFIAGAKYRKIGAEKAIVKAERNVEKAMRTYLSARRQTRMIEILREKAKAQFRVETNKQIQRQLDDLMILREPLKKSKEEESSIA